MWPWGWAECQQINLDPWRSRYPSTTPPTHSRTLFWLPQLRPNPRDDVDGSLPQPTFMPSTGSHAYPVYPVFTCPPIPSRPHCFPSLVPRGRVIKPDSCQALAGEAMDAASIPYALCPPPVSPPQAGATPPLACLLETQRQGHGAECAQVQTLAPPLTLKP